MEKFIEFNVIKFLKEAKGWGKEKKRLQEKLDNITEIKGIDNSPIRSGKLHDSVSDVAAEREQIQRQIQRLDTYIDVLEYVRKKLTTDENEILDVFFFKHGYMQRNIRIYAKKHAIRERGVYELRRKTIDLMQKIITEKFL